MIDPDVVTGCKIICLLLLIKPFTTSPIECLQLLSRLSLVRGSHLDPVVRLYLFSRRFLYLNIDKDTVHRRGSTAMLTLMPEGLSRRKHEVRHELDGE